MVMNKESSRQALHAKDFRRSPLSIKQSVFVHLMHLSMVYLSTSPVRQWQAVEHGPAWACMHSGAVHLEVCTSQG